MTVKKIVITNRDTTPGQGIDKNQFVKSGDFNPLVDAVNDISDTTGVLKADTINEVTSANGVNIDGILVKDGSINHANLISYNLPWIITGAAQQALSTSTAVNVTSYFTTINSTSGALAITLAAGTLKNQLKKIQMIVDGGDATLTCTVLSGGNTIVFGDVGDYAVLAWNGTSWYPIELVGVAITTA